MTVASAQQYAPPSARALYAQKVILKYATGLGSKGADILDPIGKLEIEKLRNAKETQIILDSRRLGYIIKI
jgi:hypothetical protein